MRPAMEEQLLLEQLTKAADYALLNRVAYGKGYKPGETPDYPRMKYAKVPEDLIPEVRDNYIVIAQLESSSGVAATVFERIQGGERSLVIRGMSPTELPDLVAGAQIAVGMPPSVNHQINTLVRQTQQWMNEGVLPQRFEVSGYSLGGYGAIALKQQLPDNIIHVYSFLEPGVGGIGGELVEWLGGNVVAVPDVTVFTTSLNP